MIISRKKYENLLANITVNEHENASLLVELNNYKLIEACQKSAKEMGLEYITVGNPHSYYVSHYLKKDDKNIYPIQELKDVEDLKSFFTKLRLLKK